MAFERGKEPSYKNRYTACVIRILVSRFIVILTKSGAARGPFLTAHMIGTWYFRYSPPGKKEPAREPRNETLRFPTATPLAAPHKVHRQISKEDSTRMDTLTSIFSKKI